MAVETEADGGGVMAAVLLDLFGPLRFNVQLHHDVPFSPSRRI